MIIFNKHQSSLINFHIYIEIIKSIKKYIKLKNNLLFLIIFLKLYIYQKYLFKYFFH
jgi:hypothetical protein